MKIRKSIPNLVIILIIALVIPISLSLNKPENFDQGVIQIGMVVSDLDQSLDFYQNVVGMTKTGGFSIDGAFGKKSGLTGGAPFDVVVLKLQDTNESTQLKLMSFNKKANHPKPDHIQDDTGVQYITMYVKSMAPVVKRLKEHHVTFLGDTPTSLGDGRHFVPLTGASLACATCAFLLP